MNRKAMFAPVLAVLALSLAQVSLAAEEAAAKPEHPVVSSAKLPLVAKGETLDADKERRQGASFERRFRLDAPGVWYVWLLVSTEDDPSTAVLTWDLDGVQPLKSSRREILVVPHLKRQWVSYTRYRRAPGFKAQVNVDKPGVHTLRIKAMHGKVEVHKIALTLHYGARPKGESLDHSGDPGRGKASFTLGDISVDGFRTDYKSPPVRAGRTFHLDPEKGNDTANGRAPETAWRTPSRVNSADFRPGDAILVRRGTRVEGGLHPRGEGTPEQPVTLGAYGQGERPLIDGGTKDAVRLTHQSNWVIQDLSLTSDPEAEESGLEVLATAETPQPRNIRIYNCVAFDNGGHGIHVGGGNHDDNGYDGVLVENCLSYWNGGDGIQVNGADQNGCRNSVVRFCTAYGNPGMAGIWIHSGQNGLIERCKAYNNACINIWTWNSINVTIRHCEAFRGRPPKDAGGFDIDWGCEGCTVEYCYSHHNMGVGFLLMGHGIKDYRGFPQRSEYNLMRFCVSEGDHPGIGLTETFNFGKVFNNTVAAVGSPGDALDCGGWPLEPWDGGGYSGGWPADTEFLNNIFAGIEGANPSWIDGPSVTQNNTFDHNLYFRPGTRTPLIKWGGQRNGDGFWEGTNRGQKKPDLYSDLASFRKSVGQEKGGREGDPKLAGLGNGGYGRLPLAAYRPTKDSPALSGGKPVQLSREWRAARMKYLTETGATAWGIPMEPAEATEDYWGNKLEGTHVDIGAGR